MDPKPPSLTSLIKVPLVFYNRYFVPIAGLVLVGMIVYGGVMRMFAGGDPQRIAKANAIITWAVIGTVVGLLSLLLVKLAMSILGVSTPDDFNGFNGEFFH